MGQVERVKKSAGAIGVFSALAIVLTGCGDGGGSVAAASTGTTVTETSTTVTQSDIVLPSSVQVVTAK